MAGRAEIALEIMGRGMAGIVMATVLIIITVKILQKVTTKKPETVPEDSETDGGGGIE